MSIKPQTSTSSSDHLFRLKPLAASVRIVMAGGLLVGSIVPVYAELPIPVAGQGWVSSGSATSQIIGNTMRIDQQTDRATLNWQSFNVGRENTVQFVQPDSSSIALNRIGQQDASRILGQIIANGQVYLYNKNGFVFGKDSVVNANSFLASTLEITDEAFNRGITRVFDENGTAALGINDGTKLDPKTVQILIEAGAKIHVDKGGRIIIAAPTIENKGSLSTEEHGQIILAASQDRVYLQEADKDSPFAGLVVEVNTGGKVSNVGDIFARQGNVTMAGFAVNQQGRVSATTSVNVNGSIRLVAQELALGAGKDPNKGKLQATNTTRAVDNDGMGTTAKLTFDSGSVTQIVADDDGITAIDDKLQPQSYIEGKAHTVELKANSAIVAPGGRVDITATDNLTTPSQGKSGRIYVDKDALIDVSGYDGVPVPMERNVGEISVQSYELRDAPLQKTGVLKGETIRVDLRKDTKIVDTSGALARVVRSIDERLSKGGQINLTSSGDVIINDGAMVDISGGSIDYQDGYITSTKLLTDYGRIVDISNADPNEHYAAIYGVVREVHKKWGIERVWDILGQYSQGQFEQGYREGKSAGSINVNSPRLFWNGALTAGTNTGRYQRLPGDRPDGGSFVFDSTAFVSIFQNVRFQTDKSSLAVSLEQPIPDLAKNKPQTLVLSTDLTNKSGVQHVVVKTNGQATVAADADIRMDPGAEFSLQAVGIDMQGQIHAAGGEINLTVPEKLAGQVNLGPSAIVDVSGRWINDLQRGLAAVPLDPLYVTGGSVNIHATKDLFLQAGSKILADGGAVLAQNGKLTAGKGGKIELAAVGNGVASAIHLDGEVSAASLSNGGSLTLNSGEIIFGNGPAKTADPLRLAQINGHLAFDPESGFGALNVIGNFAGVTVASDVDLDLKSKNLVLEGDFRGKITGSSIRDFAKLELLPEHLRQPFQLSLAGNTDVILETGSSIVADKESTVSLASAIGGVYVDGLIDTPAGKINLSINPKFGAEYDPSQSIRLGAHARLLAQGTSRMMPVDVSGLRTGSVLDGGQVTFDLKRGYFLAENGSLIDVSGTHNILDLPKTSADTGLTAITPVDVASNAGGISITVAEGAVLDGAMRANAGSESMRAGSFSLTFDNTRRQPPEEPKVAFPHNNLLIRIRENHDLFMPAGVGFGDNIPASANGQSVVSAAALQAAGFGDISFSTPDEIRFEGNVSLTTQARLDLDASRIGWVGLNGITTGSVNLTTPLLRMGSSLQQQVSGLPVSGGGQLTANAQWIELFGATQWNRFNQIDLNSVHDLRTVGVRSGAQREFLGAMVAAANLNLHASQIYPTTLSKFTFAVKNNPTGQINISGTNTDISPLSAAGELSFEAPVINQAGVLKAPLGKINLIAGSKLTLAEDSLTSVSAKGQIIPFGVTVGGLDWLYPLDTVRNLVFNTPPEKKLVLQAPEVILSQGSTVDISGGGDLYGYEFQAGSGGSDDYLKPGSATYEGGFAVIPNLGSDIAPYDYYESVGSGIELGSKVYLSGSADLPAGEYTVLPAHYALLPGAFLVTPQAKTQDQTITTSTKSGLAVVAGYRTLAGSGTGDARWSGFRIESGADVRLHSKYESNLSNAFYAAKSLKNGTVEPVLPSDGGHISISAQNKLILDSTFLVDAATGGRGARMDIAANKIQVVNQLSAAPASGTLEILANDLSDLHIDSLLLGGARTRNQTSGATDVDVTAQQVIFSADSKLIVSDLIAVATELVDVKSGAELTAKGAANSGDSLLNINGDGALLRVSSDKQVALNRTNTPGSKGELRVADGAKLSASESMLLEASKSTQLQGNIDMNGGSLYFGAKTINLGEVDNLGTSALNLSNRKLQNFSVDELVLTARDSIGIYGNLGQVDNNGQALIGDDGLQKAVQFDQLVINAAGFTGHGLASDRARIQAGNLRLQNPGAVNNLQAINGHGQLDLQANSVEIGNGNFALQGFNTVNVAASREFRAVGEGSLNTAANLNVRTAAMTADVGADLTLNVSGYNAQFQNLVSTAAISSGFGATINLIANAIGFDTKAFLPSGDFSLHALVGDVIFGEQASLDLAGRAVSFADKVDYTPGGNFKAVADHGKVILAAGSSINMNSGGGDAAGGQLTLEAPEQSVVLQGRIQAAAGSAHIDVAGFDTTTSFDAVIKALSDAGINQSIYFRTRQADIVQSVNSTINAQSITWVADRGAMSLAGAIHADAVAEGGLIQLYAGDGITLESGGTLTAMGGKGGKVLLSSVDADSDSVSGIDLKAGALIDVSGNSAANGGNVTLRALRQGNSIQIQPIAGSVIGAKEFYAEGVRKYTDANGFITSTDIDTIKADTDAYMTAANMQAVTATLGSGVRLQAGVELNYHGDLVLAEQWDFVDWRYNEGTGLSDIPGHLIMRADGKFTLNQSLSDGFKDGVLIGAAGIFETPVSGMLQAGESWSYGLTAGADLSSADPTATAAAKDLVIGSNVKVRTGTGDMQLVAGGNIVFTDQTSTVYNAGRATDTNAQGTVGVLTAIGDPRYPYAEYPIEGGLLSMKAGKDIKGAVNMDQFIDAWLIRQGDAGRSKDDYLSYVASNLEAFKDDATALSAFKDTLPNPVKALIYDNVHIDTAAYQAPTTWGIVLNDDSFQQNVGSFGGGKVEISAAGNITDLSVMMPTTGKQVGQPGFDANYPDSVSISFPYLTNQVEVNGGGQMWVRAGGDVAGGAFYLGQGQGSIIADGAIKGGSQFTAGPQLVMGDAQIELLAKSDLNLGAVSDPMMLHSGSSSFFFSYGDASKVVARSLSGDVHLGADVSKVDEILHLETDPKTLSVVYPSSLQATAFGGSVILDNEIILFPSAQAELNLLAEQNITSKANATRLGMSDADRALLPTALSPVASNVLSEVVERISPFGLAAKARAVTPVHSGDTEPARLITKQGDIKNIQISLAKKALVKTGRDFTNVMLNIEHPNLEDTSLLDVGRDLFYTSDRSLDGVLNGNLGQIKVLGAGDVLVKVNRDFDLGASNGLSSAILDTGPSVVGASITVMSGLNGGNPDYAAFIGKYLEGNPLYVDDLAKVANLITGFMQKRSGNFGLAADEALAEFKTLPVDEYLAIEPELNALIVPVYMSEIRESGKASARSGKLGNESGFAAVETLFPGKAWDGDLSLFFSKIQTQDGGDINLLVPGGKINAGLAVSFNGSKKSSELGIVAQGDGAVNAVIDGDFLVNQSRVFALGGGDITVWSSKGNIDAGSGAKSVLAVPPAEISYPKGNLKYKFPPIVSGSGIRTAASSSSFIRGDVYLFAPKGVIDAGEAGIGGNNVTVVGTAILGGPNIDVGGVGTGVPVAATGSVAAGLTGTSNMTAGVSQMAESSVSANSNDTGKDAIKNAVLGMLSVEILGFGE
ncbi:hypothetical protein [Methylomonas albis]|uniref:Filamentous hemagglutinin family protein n=1 Tax=Methylomonas albis TaxID=1854563 RepID=A0ABR9CXZ9_9GAMM|nr:filamentous haemagglutinin family protein [Methylomonas albis]MBD9355738.1 filamentous hemagglutinin family protein [Methylomonas albis]CAD6878755.1 hypothetical protein [Methylomonas albis]